MFKSLCSHEKLKSTLVAENFNNILIVNLLSAYNKKLAVEKKKNFVKLNFLIR